MLVQVTQMSVVPGPLGGEGSSETRAEGVLMSSYCCGLLGLTPFGGLLETEKNTLNKLPEGQELGYISTHSHQSLVTAPPHTPSSTTTDADGVPGACS